jgi:hypothetical protein
MTELKRPVDMPLMWICGSANDNGAAPQAPQSHWTTFGNGVQKLPTCPQVRRLIFLHKERLKNAQKVDGESRDMVS